jgi:hypothetical protein
MFCYKIGKDEKTNDNERKTAQTRGNQKGHVTHEPTSNPGHPHMFNCIGNQWYIELQKSVDYQSGFEIDPGLYIVYCTLEIVKGGFMTLLQRQKPRWERKTTNKEGAALSDTLWSYQTLFYPHFDLNHFLNSNYPI